ncbi:MAG: ribose-phosphate diphosphokinase [Candidatus Nealsonbacteria bacterium]|nr:ribose-phosphate diphosphokinase [Candidatus Nealsonbacteria bacterium]
MKGIKIFSGKSHRKLAKRICRQLEVPLSPLKIEEYGNGCSEVILEKYVRNKIVFLIQTSSPKNLSKHLLQLLLMTETVSECGAKKIIVIMPYVSYSRSDKKHKKCRNKMIIAGKWLIRALEKNGMNKFIGIDFHSKRFEKFFSPETEVHHLSALPLIVKALEKKNLNPESTIILAPDKGACKKTSHLAKELKIPFGWVEKKRISDTKVEIEKIHGEVAGKDVIVLDDEISTGGTIKTLADKLTKLKARSLTIAVTHGLFLGKALKNFQKIKILKKIIVTDTVPISKKVKRHLPLEILPIDELLAEKIKEICKN